MDRRMFITMLAGGMVAAPLVFAQPTRVYRLGLLAQGSPPYPDGLITPPLRELGYIEG